MRILQLAASDIHGGAARSAWRLHQGLRAMGQESNLLVQDKYSKDESVYKVTSRPSRAQKNEAASLRLIQRNYLDSNRTAISNTYFSLGAAGCDPAAHPLARSADVINLHWVTGFLSAAAIARLHELGKPLVWTLHDQRPFTGGCHFSTGCNGFETGCAACPQLREDPLDLPAALLADQQEMLPARHITVVAPSRWLADCARRSRFFRDSRVEHIPYGLDTSVFCPTEKTAARRQLGIDPQASWLLFGADNGAEIRKGFRELLDALRHCLADPGFAQRARNRELGILCFGNPSPELVSLPVRVQQLGYIETDSKLALAYSAADVFLLPSLEDNLPNTALESMACATPVIGFSVGGVPDLVEHEVTGKLVPRIDAQEFARATLDLLAKPGSLPMLGRNCRERVERDFTLAAQAKRYVALYQQLLAARKTRQPAPAQPTASAPDEVPWLAGVGPRLAKLSPKLITQSRRIARRRQSLAGKIGKLGSRLASRLRQPKRAS